MRGALLSWGHAGAPLAELLRVVRRHRVSRVLDLRVRATGGYNRVQIGRALARAGVSFSRAVGLDDLNVVGRLYSDARSGQRILLLDRQPAPEGTARGELLAAIARDSRLYAASLLANIILPIDIAHVVGKELRKVEGDGAA